jgi:general secretion pathway protein D
VILQVWPRISPEPENMVLMDVYAEKSDTSTSGGIPIGISNGQPVVAPRFDIQKAQTTVSVSNGQTVVLGGLITKRRSEFHRKVPGLGDVPVLGRLFRYDGVSETKTELLIILTPHVVRKPEDAEAIKRIEAARMNWCLTDVTDLMPDDAFRLRSGPWGDHETNVIYPDNDPRVPPMPLLPEPIKKPEGESIPPPSGTPQMLPQNSSSGLPQIPPSPAAPSPPDLPREPAALPASGQSRAQPSAPVSHAAVVRVPATATAQSSPPSGGDVIPTLYDAPLRYPTTQTPFYR